MEKNSLLLADSSFTSQPSQGCHLLMQVTEDGFSYAIINQDDNTPKVLFSVQQPGPLNHEISQAFSNDHFLSLKFASVKVAVQTSNVLFLPEDLYEEKQTDNYHSFVDRPDEITKHRHADLKMVTLFGINPELKNLLPAQTIFFPILSPLWICANQGLSSCFLVDFGSNLVTFLYQKDGKLIFQNSFAASNIEEFNYFLLLVKQQLSLEETTPILMQGLVENGDDYANCLQKYFLDVKINLPKTLSYNELTAQMPQHYFNSLLAILLCE
ncbi:hypothetical protein ABIB40_003171 [Pedobacter sp. UYP30]|uniref:DUF3822 family protein n=1 Tax=Pedobacter sp. UYP30 TaxID=1756400 RepID=UPI003396B788